jgi:hypothetical protein
MMQFLRIEACSIASISPLEALQLGGRLLVAQMKKSAGQKDHDANGCGYGVVCPLPIPRTRGDRSSSVPTAFCAL